MIEAQTVAVTPFCQDILIYGRKQRMELLMFSIYLDLLAGLLFPPLLHRHTLGLSTSSTYPPFTAIMGNKLSMVSTSSSRSLSSSSSTKSQPSTEPIRDRPLSMTHVPRYLKPSKSLTKKQREQLEKIRQRNNGSRPLVGVAIPYQPDNNLGTINKNSSDATSRPLFAFIQKGSQFTLDPPIEEQKSRHGNITGDYDGPKDAFHWLEGRRYQNQDDLLLPNDQRELDRLRVLNYILRWAFEGDTVAPVKEKLIEGAHVLSVGCGPGIWLGHPVIDFALDHKQSYFTAVDVLDLLPDHHIDHRLPTPHHEQDNKQSYFDFSPLHPMLPTTGSCSTWQQGQHPQQNHSPQSKSRAADLISTSDTSSKSSNKRTAASPSFSGCESSASLPSCSAPLYSKFRPTRSLFDNLDIYALDVREDGLPFLDNTFDFVMQRLSTPAYTSDQWNNVVAEMVRVTRPGGYVQFIEIDYNAQGLGPAGRAWQEKLCGVMEKSKKLDPFMASHIDIVLKQNGVVNIEKKKVSIPFGRWGLDIGILWQQNLEAFIEASAPVFSSALGVSAAECISMWQEYKDELDHVKAFANVYAVWGQKPPSES